MNVHDWALITFTILVQMAVGSMWVLGITHYFASRKYGIELADKLSDKALLALVPVIGLGFLASVFHLGNPLNAYRAVSNLANSWLSREIFFGVLFALIATAFAFMQWRKIGSSAIRTVIAWMAAVVGLVLVFSMSSVYMLSIQPTWNSWMTPVSFFTTTFLLGTLAMGAAYVATYSYEKSKNSAEADKLSIPMRDALRWIAIAAICLLGVEFVLLPLYLSTLVVGAFSWVVVLRLVLAFVGAGIFGIFLYKNALSPGQEKVLASVAYSAFMMVFVAEVLGRFIFYVLHVQVGM
jgi:anaerobic dimethyl sulfoxide reductase subunit C (anchor subunit)